MPEHLNCDLTACWFNIIVSIMANRLEKIVITITSKMNGSCCRIKKSWRGTWVNRLNMVNYCCLWCYLGIPTTVQKQFWTPKKEIPFSSLSRGKDEVVGNFMVIMHTSHYFELEMRLLQIISQKNQWGAL